MSLAAASTPWLRQRAAHSALWLRQNLFSSWANGIASAIGILFLGWLGWQFLEWGVVHASWQGESRDACLKPQQGACWAFVRAKWSQFLYGRYAEEELWRVQLVFALMALSALLLFGPWRKHAGWRIGAALGLAPILIIWLLLGGAGLTPVPTTLWGGLLLTLVVALSGIAASFPIGILLALARQSSLRLLRLMAIGFIEFVRGVPLITVLFMASIMLPLFFPPGVQFDKLMNCLIGVALFASAYMAEVVRGGLQAIGRGQYEAARALGLTYWQMQRHVVLPQALGLVVPGIVNTFIGLFKDTSLVLIIGLFDLLGIVQFHFTDASWSTPQTRLSGYAFAGAVFWAFCYAMSRYSQSLERQLERGKAHESSA